MNLEGGGGECRVGGGGVGGVVMDKIPHWLQNACMWREMGILNTSPPEPSPNSILQKKNTHSYSRNIGCEIPPRKKKKNRHSNEMRLFLHGL